MPFAVSVILQVARIEFPSTSAFMTLTLRSQLSLFIIILYMTAQALSRGLGITYDENIENSHMGVTIY